MKANAVIFSILTVYFVIVGAMYTVWNLVTHGYIEWAGSTALILCAGLNGFIAFYLFLVLKKQAGTAPQDLEEADIDDADPELGEFSPWSWWPMMLAFSCAFAFLGLAIGFNFWFSYFMIPMILVSVVGWVYEYYRGHFAR